MTDAWRGATHLDGTPIFTAPADTEAEREVANQIEHAWRCEIHHYGALSPVDWYSTRDGRLIGTLELKTRTHATTTYPTVFLNVRKWLALKLAEVGLDVPALFVVRFTDAVRWCRIQDVDARRHRIGGRPPRTAKTTSDIEPLIEVPVATMRPLAEREAGSS